MARLEELIRAQLVNDQTTITVMHMGRKTIGKWYEDQILAWKDRQLKAVWYDKRANQLDVMIDEEAKE